MRISDWSSDLCSSDLVGKHYDQPLFEGHKPDQVHEEGLAGTVLADDEPNCRTAIGDPVHVLDEFLDLTSTSDLNVPQPQFGHNPEIGRAACLERGCQYV